MIKKIPIREMRLGMFIQDLNVGWMAHAFMRPRFMLKRDEEIEKIRASGVESVYIDTLKGLDVAGAPTRDESDRSTFMAMAASLPREPWDVDPRSRLWQEEAVLARNIQARTTRVLAELFQQTRMGRPLQLDQARPMVEEITSSLLRHPSTLLSLCRLKERDAYTFQHSVAVSALLVRLGMAEGFTEARLLDLGLGGLLHDAGKMAVPDEVLNKPAALTDGEYDIMKGHVGAGETILRATPGLPEAALLVAAQHHERFEGHGYPVGLRGKQISLLGRMAAIADVYDALTSRRVYHEALPPPMALARIYEWGQQHFDMHLVQRFVQALGIYPVGSLVRLESGHLAVVVDTRSGGHLTPVVRVFYDLRRERSLTPWDLDLASPESGGDMIEAWEDPALWGMDPLTILAA